MMLTHVGRLLLVFPMPFVCKQADVDRLYSRFAPKAQIMDTLGLFLAQQTDDRFATQGASSGEPWKPKRASEWGYHDGRNILGGISGVLRKSFFGYGKAGEAICASDCFYSLIHQCGTVGKGGTLPDIKPKHAKALFIPLTDRAINSERMTGTRAGAWAALTGQVPYGAKPPEGPRRFGVTHHNTAEGRMSVEYNGLIKGRLKDNRLEGWDARRQEWSQSVSPDFLWLGKVSIPKREMLPTSPGEIQEALRCLCDASFYQQKSRRLRADGSPA